MCEIIAATILCILATLGFVTLIKSLIFKICKPKNGNAYVVLDINKTSDDTEFILRSWETRIRWLSKTDIRNIIIVDSGINNEQRKICQLMCKECEIFKLCTPEELYRIIYKKIT